MARQVRTPAPDQAQRDAIVAEQKRNVLVDAGAGTGKTAILVARFVEMVAPAGAHPPVPIGRIAAITFTRKAAGELRLRIREQLLEELGRVAHGSNQETWLRNAVAGLDTAYVGTIHSFADRLLRLRPAEARLSPSYEIAEDDELLIHETFEVLLQAVESGTLAAELVGSEAASLADEATSTILDALNAGLKPESKETDYKTFHGLSSLIEGFIRLRDLPPPEAPPAPFDKAAFKAAVDEFGKEAAGLPGGSVGADWIVRTVKELRHLCKTDDLAAIFRETKLQLRRMPGKNAGAPLRDICAGDKETHRVWKVFNDGTKDHPDALKDDLLAPLHRWMATRLVRLFPVVVALYERIKRRHRQLDQLDMLVKLRDLLVGNLPARGDYQGMFDHVFVDEFQDTDPLQAEIVLYLCELKPRAKRWQDVVLADGKLTVVGDPKQSIYRFRRADVAMYDHVRGIIAKGAPLDGRLSANFRSVPSLIDWLNNRFERILGVSTNGKPFDPATGQVFQQELKAGRDGKPGQPVHVVSFDFGDGDKHGVSEYRELEGRALARYLRMLVESGKVQVVDPLDSQTRPVRYGDIAILAVSTYMLSLLFPRFDEEGIPYASRGGKLFLEDALHRQFLLGLRAIANRDDGVAEAALLRPPFFAVDPLDLLLARAARDEALPTEPALRAREALDLVRDLRRRRFDRPPGATARDLLDRTAFARTVAMGSNGTQRLARLRELCLILEQTAADEGLDYDGATARMRDWVDDPIQLDPPHPVGTEAVQILTVHQAKGLEFPAVAIWDGKGRWDQRPESGPWRMDRDSKGWMMDLAELTWEEPAGIGIQETEKKYLDAERRRVVYVAATRARDLLIIPKAGEVAPGRFICGDLLAGAPPHLVKEVPPFIDGREPAWSKLKEPRTARVSKDGSGIERKTDAWWTAASAESARPRFRPASVSGESRAAQVDDNQDVTDPAAAKPSEGRFGNVFGTTVHEAIGLVLRDPALSASEAVAHASRRTGLVDHLEEAAEDVTRGLDALRAEGLLRPLGPSLRIEYPIAAAADAGKLLSGYIDLVSVTEDSIDLIDFKTDQPPDGSVETTYPGYVAQVQTYGRMIGAAGLIGTRSLRCGLLFTADGSLRWMTDST